MRLLLLSIQILLVLPVHCQTGYIEGNPKLAFWTLGENAEIVIVLHGGPSVEHSYLRPEFDGLQKSVKIIYYDQRGCGKSEAAETYIWQEHLKDLHRVIKQQSNGNKVYLAGSSWGSILALLYTYSHPEDIKGLILSGLVSWKEKQ